MIIGGAALSVLVVAGGIFLVVRPAPVANVAQMNAIAASAGAAEQAARSSALSSQLAGVRANTAAFIGDSYTSGTGGTASENRWTALLAADQGWMADNFGVGGTGYANRSLEAGKPAYYEQVPEVVATGDGIIIVSGGRNDLGLWLSDPVGTAMHISDTFNGLRAGAPNGRILALNPWWDDDPSPIELQSLSDAVQAAVTAVHGEFIQTGQPLAAHPEFVIEDGVHPNDAGHAALAAATANALAGGR